ncbi:MAG: hypothetical protein HFI37_02690 [Lachnospiraceae bacterium]|nr:hypothetical protein [Lachnospiraceae bacterium]
MTKLIELREKILGLYRKNSRIIIALVKFVLAFITFININYYVGYMKSLSHVYVPLIFAVICAFLPINASIYLGAVMIILHLYALSLEAAATAGILFLILFFVYFRFTPKEGYGILVTPIAFICRVPYVMPIATGLLGTPASIISVIFGTVLHYFLNGIHNNALILGNVGTQEENVSKFTVVLNQSLGNREMYLVIGAMVLAMLAVYIIRRRFIDHAWSIAITAGLLTEFLILCIGYLIMGITGKFLWLLLGTLFSGVIGMILEFLFFNLDYSRTEKVQFEDDEYYYYVKAVPKISVSSSEKQVKRIAGKKVGEKEREDRIRKELARDLDIDEDMLD